jgi:carbonic anhydrase
MSEPSAFDDLFAANADFVARFADGNLAPRAARGLAVVTCMDSRIDPFATLGIKAGDAKILRNAGGRVTDDVLRSLVLAVNLLGVDRVCIVQHTGCRMIGATNEELQRTLGAQRGVDASGWDFLPIEDHDRTLRADLARIRDCPLLPPELTLAGFVYDVDTGRLRGAT